MALEQVSRHDAPSPDSHLGALPAGTWIRATQSKGDAVLVLGGEFDMASDAGLRRALSKVLAAGPHRLVVDLTEVSFIDARTIGEFVRTRNSLRHLGADLVLRAPSTMVSRVLRLMGLDDLVCEDLTDGGSGDQGVLSIGHHVDELVASWAAACHTAPFGAASFVFSDPASVVSALAIVLDHPYATMSPDVLSALEGAVVRAGDSSPTIAVMQVFALSRVVRTMFEDFDDERRQPTRLARLEENLDLAVGEMISVVLDELEQNIEQNDVPQKAGSNLITDPMPKPARESAPVSEPGREVLHGNRAAVAIEQAKGLIAEHFGVGIAQAAVILRDSSRRREQPIGSIAAEVVERTLTVDELAPDRQARVAVDDSESRVT